MRRYFANFLFSIVFLLGFTQTPYAEIVPHTTLATYVQALPLYVTDWTFVGERRLEEGQGKYSAKYKHEQSGQEMVINVRASVSADAEGKDRKDAGAIYGWDIFNGERDVGERQVVYNFNGVPLLVTESEKVFENIAYPVVTLRLYPNEYAEFKVRGYKQVYPIAYQLIQIWYQNLQTLTAQALTKDAGP